MSGFSRRRASFRAWLGLNRAAWLAALGLDGLLMVGVGAWYSAPGGDLGADTILWGSLGIWCLALLCSFALELARPVPRLGTVEREAVGVATVLLLGAPALFLSLTLVVALFAFVSSAGFGAAVGREEMEFAFGVAVYPSLLGIMLGGELVLRRHGRRQDARLHRFLVGGAVVLFFFREQTFSFLGEGFAMAVVSMGCLLAVGIVPAWRTWRPRGAAPIIDEAFGEAGAPTWSVARR